MLPVQNSSSKSLTVSAHNPMTGPRHLGQWASTVLDWPQYQDNLVVVVDDVIGAILYPGARQSLEARSLFTMREFMVSNFDVIGTRFVLTSMIPELFELSFYASMVCDQDLVATLYEQTFPAIIGPVRRKEMGLGVTPSAAELNYPQIGLASLVIGLGASFLQGGEEMAGYVPCFEMICSRLPAEMGSQPKYLPARFPFVLGTDGEHMGDHNAVYISSPERDVESALRGCRSPAALEQWGAIFECEDSLDPSSASERLRRTHLVETVIERFRPYRECALSKGEVVERLELDAWWARERLSHFLDALKSVFLMPGHG